MRNSKYRQKFAWGALLALSVQLAHAQAALGLNPVEGAGSLHDRAGEMFTFVCPASNGEDTNVYGTDTYTDSSPICPAAIHAGKLKRGQSGIVTIRIGKGARSFVASSRNGVMTRGYTAWPYSYEFVGNEIGVIGWGTVWSGVPSDFAGSVTLRCPAGGGPAAVIYGTDVYTSGSAICVAAVHAGTITAAAGGLVAVHRVPGASDFPGSRRNGVESRGWGGAHPDAFSLSVAAAPSGVSVPATPSSVLSSPRQPNAESQRTNSPTSPASLSRLTTTPRAAANIAPISPLVHAPASTAAQPVESPKEEVPASTPAASPPAASAAPAESTGGPAGATTSAGDASGNSESSAATQTGSNSSRFAPTSDAAQQNYTSIGSVSGDKTSESISKSGTLQSITDKQFFRFTMREDDESCLAIFSSCRKLSATIRLTGPSELSDFDLFVYRKDGSWIASSQAGIGQIDTVVVRVDETLNTDSTYFVVEVRAHSFNAAAANFTLSVNGNTSP